MFRGMAFSLCIFVPTWVGAQQVTVEVWSLAAENSPPVPSSKANVRRYPAANQPPGPDVEPQRPTATGPQQNQYVLNASGLGQLVDVTIRQSGYHPWAVRDLFVATGGDQKVNVQLFKYDYPIRAPECFALKTQYELLFRNEQRLKPNARRREIEHSARLKYADGLLALPNPSRAELQPPWVQQMLDRMEDDDRNELNDMLNGLFNLYEMDAMTQFVPTTWDAAYQSPSGQVHNQVRLYGTYGEYVTDDGQAHRLEEVDIFPSDSNDGGDAYIVAGKWRFQNPPASGTFRWVVDSESRFNGTWRFDGDNRERSWTGQMVEQIQGGLLPPPPDTVEAPEPPRIPPRGQRPHRGRRQPHERDNS